MTWLNSIPVRIARFVIVHRVQGASIERLELTLGKQERPGVTNTGLSRAISMNGLLILPPYDNDRLVRWLNKVPESPDFDIAKIFKNMTMMSNRTLER